MSEGIIKKVKGDDAEWRLAKQRQHTANHRAREPEKQRYQQVISITGSPDHRILPAQVTSLSFWTSLFSPVKVQSSNCRLLASTHRPHVTKARAALHPHVRTLI